MAVPLLAGFPSCSISSPQLVAQPVGLCSPRPQYSTSSSCFNYSLSWLIVKLNKARNGLILDERTCVYRSIVARYGAVGGGGLLLKLVKVVVLSSYPPLY